MDRNRTIGAVGPVVTSNELLAMRISRLHTGYSWRVLFLLWAWSGAALGPVIAQTGPQRGTATATAGNSDHVRAVAFEVVSIRPSNASAWSRSIDPNGDTYRSAGMPLGDTILNAYFPAALQSRSLLPGAPGWIWKDRFDFVGKVAPEDVDEWHQSFRHGFDAPNPMLEAMLRAALADRCKLVVHRIPATFPGFALVVSNRGVNTKRFSAAKPGEAIPDNALKMSEDGRMVPILSPDEPTVQFFETSTASLAATMSRWGAPVEDRTSLNGKYDFALTRLSTEGDPSIDWDVAALGLKLVPINIPTEKIVIDHIEYPSRN
jgi:uncharacterized protein (TIGR03435 family)